MSRIRAVPSAGSGSTCGRVKPTTAPAVSCRTRTETTRSALPDRTTATSRLPSRETISSVSAAPGEPRHGHLRGRPVDDLEHPRAAVVAVEHPDPVAVVPVRRGQVDGPDR